MKISNIGKIFFLLCLATIIVISGCTKQQDQATEETGEEISSEGTDEEPAEEMAGEETGAEELPYPVIWSFAGIGGSTEYSFGPPLSSSPAIDSEGNIYGVSGEKLYKIDSNGNKVWELQITEAWEEFISTPPAIASDGTIYVGTYNPSFGVSESEGRVYAITPDGTFKWDSPHVVKEWDPVMNGWVPDNTVNPFAIAEDGTIYTAGKNGFVQAINPDGTLKWTFDTLDLEGSICHTSSRSSPSIGEDGTIYVGYDGGSLLAINPDGTLKWEHKTDSCCIVPVPAIDGGTIYVGDESGKLYAIIDNGADSEELWSFQTNGAIYSSPAIDANGDIYVGSNDGKLYKINNGEKVWEFATGGKIFSSPAIDANGNVYFGSADEYYYKVESEGWEVWKFNPSNIGNGGGYGGIAEATGSPTIGDDGTIYFIGGGQLIAAEGEAELASSPWPKFKQNNQNTG